ncbi:MAG: ZIP family metal transporter [Lachnospiraceae bacterium]|nr:ZIP family metal transporter [Lachnospiraceae bacterium]
MEIFAGVMLPFVGTTLGASCVLFMKKGLKSTTQRALAGFAAGVMVAASVWSLLIPAMNYSEDMGKLAFVPALVGFIIGILFLLILDNVIPHIHAETGEQEGPKSNFGRTTMMVFAVALHNIPEGMAVGVVFAGLKAGGANITMAAALALSIGIAIQNFPEGAIVSMPLRAEGVTKRKAWIYGIVSGIVEPLAAIITIELASLVLPVLPYLLSFAAGAMIYVVVEELIPEAVGGKHSNIGTIMFAIGFALMMVLDVALG